MREPVMARWIIGLEDEPFGEHEGIIRQTICRLSEKEGKASAIPEAISSRVIGYLGTSPALRPHTRSLLENRILMSTLPLEGPHGFLHDGTGLPAVSVGIITDRPGGKTLNIVMPQSFLDRIMARSSWLNILSQVVFRELCVLVEGLSPLAARIEESQFNSFSFTGSVMSDLLRDTLEGAADRCDPVRLEEIAGSLEALEAEIRELPADKLKHEDVGKALDLVRSVTREALVFTGLQRIQDYATSKPLMLRPSDIIAVKVRAELSIAELPCLYLPPYLAGSVMQSLGELAQQKSSPQVRVIRDIIAYKRASDASEDTSLADSVSHWVELYIEFCARNIEGLELLQTGIMGQADIREVRMTIEAMIELHGKLCTGSNREFRQELAATIEAGSESETFGLALNRLINRIHQDVLLNVFGVFKGWKKVIGEVNTISNKVVCVTVDGQGEMEYYPANKVNVIDFSGDFMSGRAVPARSIIESYLSTNIHLRDNCYIDCISHTNKAWFFVDLGVHGANIFVDLDPNKPMITVSYAEGNVEDGNMARLRMLEDSVVELGFSVSKTEITLMARLDEKTSGVLDAKDLVDKAVWTIQAFASVADFDQEIEDGRITDRSLAIHRKRISASGTGFPLYIISRGSIELNSLSETLRKMNAALLPLLNRELDRLGLMPIPEKDADLKTIESRFNRIIENGIREGEYLSLAQDPLFRNPGYERPDPLPYLMAGLLSEDYLTEVSGIVNILDKVVGSISLGTVHDESVTMSTIGLANGIICLYALRDHTSYKPLKAFAVNGPCLRKVHLSDNVIRDISSLRTLLEEHEYHLETIEKRIQWSSPIGVPISGITVGAVASCPGIASGFLKKAKPEGTREDFRTSIFSDTLLTPETVGKLQDAAGFITTSDSTLSHAQLTARTYGKPGVILHEARWSGEEDRARLLVSLGKQHYPVSEGMVVTVDGFRGMVALPGASLNPEEDFSALIRETFSLLVSIEQADHPRDLLAELRGLINRSDNIGILTFIIQELFISQAFQNNLHKLEVLKCLWDSGRDDFISPIKGYMKDIILESRRRQHNDIEVARKRIAKAIDLVEAFFVITRVTAQLNWAIHVEDLICPRVDLTKIDYLPDMNGIRSLFASRREEFTEHALTRIRPLLEDLGSLSDPALERLLRIMEGARLPLPEEMQENEPLARYRDQIRPLVQDRLQRFEESRESHVMDLRHTGRLTAPYVGNKAASLGELMRGLSGLTIPPGFVLTSLGIREIIDHNSEGVRRVKAVFDSRPKDRASRFEEIIPLLLSFSFPLDLEQRITFFYHGLERDAPGPEKIVEIGRLADICGNGRVRGAVTDEAMRDSDSKTIGEIIPCLALPEHEDLMLRKAYENEGGLFAVVRSSSVHEDTRTDMMAGKFMSYPYIRGRRLILEAILKCLACSWAETGELTDSQPVLIHRQVESDVAMVVNSINLSEHRWDEVIVNAAWGAGAGLVSSKVESDLYIIDAASCSIKHAIPGTKKTRTVFDIEAGHGTTTASIENRSEQKRQILSKEDAARVAQLAQRIHNFYQYPVDIEAVMREGVIHVVQVRPLVFPFSPA
jgi:phosphoenolpyruvate synthase/pyruvate phosphate dikinase